MSNRTFENTGDTFSAYNAAVAWLSDHGYTVGSMERDNPIGFHRDAEYISKWTRMSPCEQKALDGYMESQDFRNGPVTVLFREAGKP